MKIINVKSDSHIQVEMTVLEWSTLQLLSGNLPSVPAEGAVLDTTKIQATVLNRMTNAIMASSAAAVVKKEKENGGEVRKGKEVSADQQGGTREGPAK